MIVSMRRWLYIYCIGVIVTAIMTNRWWFMQIFIYIEGLLLILFYPFFLISAFLLIHNVYVSIHKRQARYVYYILLDCATPMIATAFFTRYAFRFAF
jgi:hypothetical protein